MHKQAIFQCSAREMVVDYQRGMHENPWSCHYLMRYGANHKMIKAWVKKLRGVVVDLGFHGGGPNTPLSGVIHATISHRDPYSRYRPEEMLLRLRLLRAEAYDCPLAPVIREWMKDHI